MKVRTSGCRLAFIVGLFIICATRSHSGFAWSLETHLYIATQVYEDVTDDGAIHLCTEQSLTTGSVDCTRQYPVPPRIVNALRGHKEAFLAGTLGPDVYPDFITAQVTVHPGLEDGWPTHKWLSHILQSAKSDEEIAWAYGYTVHAASDVFAHSWVNYYAGDIFEIGSHFNHGNEAELRHFTLERFVADRTVHTWEPATPSAPHDFIADYLILDGAAARQYRISGIPAHLVAIQAVYQSVSKIHENAVDIQHQIAKEAAVQFQPLQQAKVFLAAAKLAVNTAQAASKLAHDALTLRDKIISEAESQLRDLADLIDKAPNMLDVWSAQITSFKTIAEGAEITFGALQEAVNVAQRAYDAAKALLDNTGATITESVCKSVVEFVCPICPDIVKDVCEDVTTVNPAWAGVKAGFDEAEKKLDAAKRALEEAKATARNARNEMDRLQKQIEKLNQAVKDAGPAKLALNANLEAYRQERLLEAKAVDGTDAALEAANAELIKAQNRVDDLEKKLQPLTDLIEKYDPIILFLANWRDDIRKAAIAYSETSEQVAKRIVAKSTEDKLALYWKWYECWSPVFTAIPSEVPQTACTAKDIYDEYRNKFDEAINNIADRLGILAWVLLPNVMIEREFNKRVREPLEKEVKEELADAAEKVTAFLSNPELAELLRVMYDSDTVTDSKINGIYESDDSHQNLLAIADIATRARQDMGISGDSKVSEADFAALYDAIVLSKLALLDRPALNSIYEDLVVTTPTMYGKSLYSDKAGDNFTLLLDAVRSIDGNQQWQAIALPYPRTTGRDPKWPAGRHFGEYSDQGGDAGLRIWGDRKARELLFKRIFRGPLNPALETHPSILANYPFPACSENPFPSTTDRFGKLVSFDHSCRLATETGSSGLPGKFSVASVRKLKSSDLNGLSMTQVRIAKNEILARHGFTFKESDLDAYFRSQSWYKPTTESLKETMKQLSPVERANFALLGAAKEATKPARRVKVHPAAHECCCCACN